MCSPTAIIAGTSTIQGFSAYTKSKAQQQSLYYNAEQNRALAEQYIEQGEEIQRQGAKQQSKASLKGKFLKGRSIAKLGGSGIQIGAGTSGQAISDIDVMSLLEMDLIESNALKKSNISLKRAQSTYHNANMQESRADSISPFTDALIQGGIAGMQAYAGMPDSKKDIFNKKFNSVYGDLFLKDKITAGYTPSGLSSGVF